jgi:hypothetical protein
MHEATNAFFASGSTLEFDLFRKRGFFRKWSGKRKNSNRYLVSALKKSSPAVGMSERSRTPTAGASEPCNLMAATGFAGGLKGRQGNCAFYGQEPERSFASILEFYKPKLHWW